jgi:hypothetical protein
MADVLDQLSQLATALRSTPESIAQLRDRVAVRRRRRRRRVIAGSVALAAAAALIVIVPGDDDGKDLRTVDDATPDAPPSIGGASLPLGSVVSGTSGIEIAVTGGFARLSNEPTVAAFSLGADLVVAQRAETASLYPALPIGPILVLEAGATRALPAPEGDVELHDAGFVDGRPVALVTVTTGSSPDDAEERLYLVDVESGDITDLGLVGGWESGLSQARLAGSSIVSIDTASVDNHVVVRSSRDGAIQWEATETVVDAFVRVVVVGDEVVALEPRFEGDDFVPQLEVHRYDLSSGVPTASGTVTLRPADGSELVESFCAYVESTGGRLLCDRSQAGPIEVDLATGATRFVEGLDAGRVTLPRGPTSEPGDRATASQSIDEARRDGVIPEVAALSVADRVEVHESIDTSAGTWALSRLTDTAKTLAAEDGCALGNIGGDYGIDVICADEYGEVLLLDERGRIVRAYPMPGTIPSWIHVATDAVYAGRTGDGALPSSTLVRIDRQTLSAQVVVFPPSDSEVAWPSDWHVATAEQAAAYPQLVAIGPEAAGTRSVSETGTVAIHVAGLDSFFEAVG